MMLAHRLRFALPVALAGTFGLPFAYADIYTWVDASGSINVSNLAPPDGVSVTKVVHESAPAAAGSEAARDAARQAETQALAERVQQLENEVEFAIRQVPPRVEYVPVPAPPVVQYIFQPAPPLVQYALSESPPANGWCDPTWLNCGFGWGPGFYPGSAIVLLAPSMRHVRVAPHGNNFGTLPPMHPSLVQPLATPLVPPLAVPLVPPLLLPRPAETFRRG